MKKRGTIIVLSGPSGVGKSTLIAEVRKSLPDLEFSISCTTRKPRNGEVNDVHYHFLCEDDFLGRIERGLFVEHAKVFAHRYGTLKSEVLDRAAVGKNVILDIDVQGAMQIRAAAESDVELKRSVVLVFIVPPSLAVLEQRLRGRATDSEEQIALRLNGARQELSYWPKYDYLVINDCLAHAAEQMTGLIRSFDLRSGNYPEDLFQ